MHVIHTQNVSSVREALILPFFSYSYFLLIPPLHNTWETLSASHFYNFVTLGKLFKWNYAVICLLGFSLPQPILADHSSLEIHPGGCLDQYFVAFYGCVVFHGMVVPEFYILKGT